GDAERPDGLGCGAGFSVGDAKSSPPRPLSGRCRFLPMGGWAGRRRRRGGAAWIFSSSRTTWRRIACRPDGHGILHGGRGGVFRPRGGGGVRAGDEGARRVSAGWLGAG